MLASRKGFIGHSTSMGPAFADPFGSLDNLGRDQTFHKGLWAVAKALICFLCCSYFIDWGVGVEVGHGVFFKGWISLLSTLGHQQTYTVLYLH